MCTKLPEGCAVTCNSALDISQISLALAWTPSCTPPALRFTTPTLTLATGNQYFVSKFLMHLHETGHDAFTPDGWSPTDVFGKFMDMANHREELLQHFAGNEGAPILPGHCVQFLSAVVNHQVESAPQGRKADSDQRLTAGYAKRVRSGALSHHTNPPTHTQSFDQSQTIIPTSETIV